MKEKSISQIIQEQTPFAPASRKPIFRASEISLARPSELAFLAKYPTSKEVENTFCPNRWSYTLANNDNAYLCDCPSMIRYNFLYGEDSAAHWITIQLAQLFFLSSSKDASLADCIRQFAGMFAHDAGIYKISELMIFFARYSIGRYGASTWQSFDLRRIDMVFHQEFLPDRNLELARLERTIQAAAREQQKQYDASHHISFEDYMKLKQDGG